MLESTPLSLFSRPRIPPARISDSDKRRFVSADEKKDTQEGAKKVNFIEHLAGKISVESVIYLALLLTIFTNVLVLTVVLRLFLNA